MKKQLLIALFFALLLLFSLKYVVGVSFRKQILHDDLFGMVPPNPLAYIQCSRLKPRVEQLLQSPDYHTFIQSEFAKQIQHTAWWKDILSLFEEIWNSLIIDPMHIIGSDLAIGVYKAGENELFPGVIVISKIDQIAKIAEQLFYAFDKLSGQIGIHFAEDYQSVPIYMLKQPEMLFPVYYTIIDYVGMISTSLPLLKNSILISTRKESLAVMPLQSLTTVNIFRQLITDFSEQRFVTCYLNLSSLSEELRYHRLFYSLNIDVHSVWERLARFPLVTLNLRTYPEKIVLEAELFSFSEIADNPITSALNVPEEKRELIEYFLEDIVESVSSELSAIGVFYRKNLRTFVQKWQTLFPQHEWLLPLWFLEQEPDIFGDVIECRMLKTLTGTIYFIPDIACVLEAQKPERVMSFFDRRVEDILNHIFSPTAQRMLVERPRESYQNTMISKVQLMFQDVFNYALLITSNINLFQHPYALLTTNLLTLKGQIDSLQTHPNLSPYFLVKREAISLFSRNSEKPLRASSPAFAFLIRNDNCAEFLRNFSQANTFTLLFPKQNYPRLYEAVPAFISFLEPLPLLFLEGGIKESHLYLVIQMKGSELTK